MIKRNQKNKNIKRKPSSHEIRNIIQWKQNRNLKTSSFNHQSSYNKDTNIHVIDKYFRCSIYLSVFWIHIRNWDHVYCKIILGFWMFRILSDIQLGSDSVRIIPITRNTIKKYSFGIYIGFGSIQINFYRIGFGLSFQVRFICPLAKMTKLDYADSDLDRSMVTGWINKVRVWKASLALTWCGGA